jgi:hypothetical protein
MVAVNTLLVLAALCVVHVQGFSRRLDVLTTCASQVKALISASNAIVLMLIKYHCSNMCRLSAESSVQQARRDTSGNRALA